MFGDEDRDGGCQQYGRELGNMEGLRLAVSDIRPGEDRQ